MEFRRPGELRIDIVGEQRSEQRLHRIHRGTTPEIGEAGISKAASRTSDLLVQGCARSWLVNVGPTWQATQFAFPRKTRRPSCASAVRAD